MNKHDLTFMKHFAQLIVGLMVLAILLILGAMHIYGSQPREENKAIIAATNARIASVGDVFSGETGKAAAEAAKAAAAEAAKGQVAYDGTLDGSVIFGNLCGACHT
jgi:cbb3-type cytochrome oxidase subunit 3